MDALSADEENGGGMARPMTTAKPPEYLCVISPLGQQGCEGVYSLVHERRINGFPAWRKPADHSGFGVKWLYSSVEGSWNIGGRTAQEQAFQCHAAHIFSGQKHNGSLPHQLWSPWWRTNGEAFCKDPEIVVQPWKPQPEELPHQHFVNPEDAWSETCSEASSLQSISSRRSRGVAWLKSLGKRRRAPSAAGSYGSRDHSSWDGSSAVRGPDSRSLGHRKGHVAQNEVRTLADLPPERQMTEEKVEALAFSFYASLEDQRSGKGEVSFVFIARPLGILFESSKERSPMLVRTVTTGSVAHAVGVKVGMVLSSIDGRSVRGLPQEKVASIIADRSRRLHCIQESRRFGRSVTRAASEAGSVISAGSSAASGPSWRRGGPRWDPRHAPSAAASESSFGK